MEAFTIKFDSSDLTDEFIFSLKCNFQGEQLKLQDLMDVCLLTNSIGMFFEAKLYDVFTKKVISIGNQFKLKLTDTNVEREFKHWGKVVDLSDKNTLIETFNVNNCVVIVSESGEGKSTESIRMYGRMKAFFPKHWIVHINLSAYTKSLSKLSIDKTSPLEYISETMLRTKAIEKEIFEFYFKSHKVIDIHF